jgi:hypothetical protein
MTVTSHDLAMQRYTEPYSEPIQSQPTTHDEAMRSLVQPSEPAPNSLDELRRLLSTTRRSLRLTEAALQAIEESLAGKTSS